MENCLVTKLKSAVSDDSLSKIGELKVYHTRSDQASYYFTAMSTVAQDVTVKIDGVADSVVHMNANTRTIILFNAASIGATSVAVFSDKYHIKYLQEGNFYCNLDDFKYNDVLTIIESGHSGFTGDISSLPGTMEKINIQYSKHITGDISSVNSMPNLEKLSISGEGLYGNLANLQTNSHLYQFRIKNTSIEGNISNISRAFPNISELSCYNNQNFNGDINSISSSNLANLSSIITMQLCNLGGSVNTLALASGVTKLNVAENPNINGSRATFKSVNSSNSSLQNDSNLNFILTGVTA